MRKTKVGIIGGGQLGMFLVQAAIRFPVEVKVYDKNKNCSAAGFVSDFTCGGFEDVDAIVRFGEGCDVVLYELEAVSLEALKILESKGVKVFANVKTLEWVKDKGLQREKLNSVGLKGPGFELLAGNEVRSYSGSFPVVQKWRTGGYDGYGVKMIRGENDLVSAAEVDSVFEELVDIEKELSVLVARGLDGEVVVYEPSEMVFDPEKNLVDYLIAPARIDVEVLKKVKNLARDAAEKLNFRGAYAIELFLTKDGEILVNEVSPRPHNSGHHTKVANVTSQYEQLIRVALGLPLGSPRTLSNCVMLNLLGEGSGETVYEGLKEVSALENVKLYFYGKKEVRPGRKMGHALIVENDLDKAMDLVKKIKNSLTITNYEK